MNRIKVLLLLLFFLPNLLFPQATEKNKRISKQFYNKAIGYISAGDYRQALSCLDTSVSLDPGFADALIQRGKVYVELQLIPRALNDFRDAAGIDSNNGEPWFYLGYLQFREDTAGAAGKNLDLAIQKGYRTSQSYYNRGLYRLLAKDFSGAIEDFTSSIGLQNNFALAYHDRAVAKYNLGDLRGALQDYLQATEFNHNFPLAFINLGTVKSDLGDHPGAVEDYSVALSLDSTSAVAYNNRGREKYLMGDKDGALADFNRALFFSENYIQASNNKACILIKNSDYKEALQVLNEIISSSPGFARAYLNRGLVKELLGDLEGACADWQKALEMGITEARNYVNECK